MAMVAAISRYEITEKEEELEHKQIKSIYRARMPEEGWEEMKSDFESELFEIEKELKPVVKILLMDGQRALWSYGNSKAEFDDYKKLIDFYHACEHLGKVVNIVFKEDWERKRWYKEWKKKLKREENGVGKILNSIAYFKKEKRLKAKEIKALKAEEKYFKNNKELMTYKEFVEQGWPIGSGPVEAACKTIVKTRMCRSGMKWEKEMGQHILHLRTLAKSERWEYFWNSYLSAVA